MSNPYTINGHVYTEAQYQQMCAEHPMYYVDRNPTQVEAESEQLRTLATSYRALYVSACEQEGDGFGQSGNLYALDEQAKTLGIEVQE